MNRLAGLVRQSEGVIQGRAARDRAKIFARLFKKIFDSRSRHGAGRPQNRNHYQTVPEHGGISRILRTSAFYRRNPSAENRQTRFTFLMSRGIGPVKPGKREMKVPGFQAKTRADLAARLLDFYKAVENRSTLIFGILPIVPIGGAMIFLFYEKLIQDLQNSYRTSRISHGS
jgi:hypothetical protein